LGHTITRRGASSVWGDLKKRGMVSQWKKMNFWKCIERNEKEPRGREAMLRIWEQAARRKDRVSVTQKLMEKVTANDS